jgi:hypothetical protein
VRPLNQSSHLIHAISDKAEHTAFLCVDKAIAEEHHVAGFIKQLTEELPQSYHNTSSHV